MDENKAGSLGELIDRMIQLYVRNGNSIREKDENNPNYRGYVECIRFLDEYELRINGGLRPGFSARIENIKH